MNRIGSAQKVALICAVGVIINVIGARIAQSFNMSLFLDTYGTIFIAALGGYVPGIAVGFFTNLLGAVFNESEMYFGIVNILVAIATTFFCQRGYYETFPKVLITIPVIVLMTSFLGSVIEEFVYSSTHFETLEKFLGHFQENFSGEFRDKGLAILVTFFLLKKFPSDFNKDFLLLGKMQAPLSDEMRNELENNDRFIQSPKNKFISSLRTKMIFNLIAITLLVAVSITAISYLIYKVSEINDRIRIADGVSSMIVSEINPRSVEEYLERGHHVESYNEVESKLRKIRASNSDIKFLYVYKIMKDGCHVVFDLDTPDTPAAMPDDVLNFEEAFIPYVPDLLAGRPIPPIISDDEYGYLLTIYKPVYNSVGECTCYVGVDFSMDSISDYGRTFIAKVISLFSGVVIFIFVLGLMFIENNIILPVNTMA